MSDEQVKSTDASLEHSLNDHAENIEKWNPKMSRRLRDAAALIAQLNERAEKIVDTIRHYWTFTETQQHTHSWHDREDCIAEIKKLLKEQP